MGSGRMDDAMNEVDGLAALDPDAVGYPSTYLEFRTDHSQTMMAHCVSLLCEGVVEELPTLICLHPTNATGMGQP